MRWQSLSELLPSRLRMGIVDG